MVGIDFNSMSLLDDGVLKEMGWNRICAPHQWYSLSVYPPLQSLAYPGNRCGDRKKGGMKRLLVTLVVTESVTGLGQSPRVAERSTP
jgi:hypothetical protein